MFGKRFVDTNVLLYALMDSSSEKVSKARSLISIPGLIISTQVINELAFNLLKKSKINESALVEIINTLFSEFQVVLIDKQIVIDASELRRKYSFSYWDSLIVASAIKNDCEILYSEDMQHGLIIRENLQLVNPFI